VPQKESMHWRTLWAVAWWSGLRLLAADWPQFLGPTANGVSTETGLIDRLPTNGPTRIWARTIGTGYSAPSIRGGRLVLFHRESDLEIVECLEAGTGKTLWKHQDPTSFRDPYGYNNGPRCSPLLTEDYCYTFGAEGRLLCLNIKDGSVVWRRETSREFEVPEAFFGVGSTPILEGGKLIVALGGQPNSGVVAFDPKTGKTLWQSVGKSCWDGVVAIGWRGEPPYRWTGVEKSASYASPVAATIHGKRHLFCLMRQGLVSLDPTDGAVNFVRWFQSQANDSVNAMTPLVVGDQVLILATYYRVGSVLLRITPDGKGFEEVWRHPKSPFERNLSTGTFEMPTLEMHWSQPILVQGMLYGFSGRNEPDVSLRCVELASGKLRWERSERWSHPAPGSEAQPKVFGRGAMIYADGRLIALGEGGMLGLFKPNPDRCDELGRWQVPEMHYPCWAGPVLSDQRLYLRSENQLICLEFAAKRL
jgi:outer membrane protein assembly factor BamB